MATLWHQQQLPLTAKIYSNAEFSRFKQGKNVILIS